MTKRKNIQKLTRSQVQCSEQEPECWISKLTKKGGIRLICMELTVGWMLPMESNTVFRKCSSCSFSLYQSLRAVLSRNTLKRVGTCVGDPLKSTQFWIMLNSVDLHVPVCVNMWMVRYSAFLEYNFHYIEIFKAWINTILDNARLWA